MTKSQKFHSYEFKNHIFIIGGVSRSGKTVLSRKLLYEKCIPNLPLDSFRAAIEKKATDESFDIRKVSKEKDPYIARVEYLWPYIKSFAVSQAMYGLTGYCIEGDALEPSKVNELKEYKNVHTIFLGFPNTKLEDKFKEVREYKDDYDWTEKLEDKELKSSIENTIKRSKYYKEECQKYDIKFIDTTKNFESQIQKAFEYLMSEHKKSNA